MLYQPFQDPEVPDHHQHLSRPDLTDPCCDQRHAKGVLPIRPSTSYMLATYLLTFLLVQRLQNLKSTREEDKTSMEVRYRQRLKEMDAMLKDNAKKERKYLKVERLQARSQETCQRLQNDILTIKHQKVSV